MSAGAAVQVYFYINTSGSYLSYLRGWMEGIIIYLCLYSSVLGSVYLSLFARGRGAHVSADIDVGVRMRGFASVEFSSKP